MARHVARVVIVILALSLLSCGWVDLPKTLWLDDKWNEEETQKIHQAIDEWNKFGREYCGEDIIIYGGRFIDKNGFDLKTDPDDNDSVIYKIDKKNEIHDFLVGVAGHPINGYGMRSDILLFTFPEEAIGQDIRNVAMHEMGHWLGLAHIPNEKNAIMYQAVTSDPTATLTKKDKQAFCIVHGCCVKEP